jgi:2-C-methyl-D-erythritol 4-phosphate cytidylyltransferase
MGVDTPKQYLQIAGASVLEHSLRALLACPGLNAIVVALQPRDTAADSLPLFTDSRLERVSGGAQRSDSVRAALDVLLARASPLDWVLVHDAARPCLRPADVELLIDRVISSGIGGILAEPVVDTVKQADADALVQCTLDRTGLWRAQTPQMFRLGELHAALVAAQLSGSTITDEASAMELAGHPVQLVLGPSRNIKVTRPSDLALAAWYLGEGSEPQCE